MNKFFKISEIAYAVIAILSILEVVVLWNVNRSKAYMFIAFGVVSAAMFVFRRVMRKRMEKRMEQPMNKRMEERNKEK